MTKPRIAIPMPTSFDLAYNRLNYVAYTDAVLACGGEPVEVGLGLSEPEVRKLAADCAGVVLPGSPADVDPAEYGQQRDPATATADLPRESVDTVLIEAVYQRRIPLLAICFGVQKLNVYRGGTLVQDLTVMPVNHSAGRAVAVAHAASVVPGSLLGGIVDAAEAPLVDGYLRLPINSSHHQAVGIAGRGLRVVARCPQDGVVEAIEGQDGHFVLGIQWHPERTMDSSATSRALFTRFVAECSKSPNGR